MTKKEKLPNIVMIVSDDQGYWAMGCANNNEIITPNLNNLAKDGIYFENFFCASPVCSPARASLFTGKIPSQHGVHDWIKRGHANEYEIADELKQKFYEDNIPWQYEWSKKILKGDTAIQYIKGQKCFTEVLSENGYKCGISGKWHLGDSKTPQAGFTYWKTIAMGGDNYYYPVVLENNKFIMKDNIYITDYITDNAISFLDEETNENNPFYLSVHYTSPHAPWNSHHHPQEIYKLYDNCEFNSTPNETPHPWSGVSYSTQQEADETRKMNLKGYFTAITAMDYSIGKIIDRLKEKNIIDNTLIIFTSDNGMNMGHHGIYGKGNGTFPVNMFDTAVKVPMIISAPFLKLKGTTNKNMLSHYDFLPTILTYLGFEKDIPENLPGNSFAEILKGNEIDDRESVVIMDEYGPTRMIRTKNWKYIHRYPYGPHELYCIQNDPEEKHNLIDDNTYYDIKCSLRMQLTDWFNKYIVIEKDGKCEAVTGKGQKDVIGNENNGKEPFEQLNI